MRLSEFITERREQVLEEWVTFARTVATSGAHMDVAALRNHASEMLDAIIADLNTPQSRAQESEKARGKSDAPQAEGGAGMAAQSHGAGRARSGFDVQQMISEYRALRSSVLHMWLGESRGIHPTRPRT
jgi:hypothetical protein